ncbi:MAG TPA: hypothetical protein VD713_03335 [Sphingomonadales bacterium]|nr:hypothetical protein [Sphingomonadales bacterium]
MTRLKTSIRADHVSTQRDDKHTEARCLNSALSFLARECRVLGYTNAASLAQNAAEAVFLELAAARRREGANGGKRKHAAVADVPERPRLPRSVPRGFGKLTRGNS